MTQPSLRDILASVKTKHAYQYGRDRANQDHIVLACFDELDALWRQKARAGQKIEAIKLYRVVYNESLKDAKWAIDFFIEGEIKSDLTMKLHEVDTLLCRLYPSLEDRKNYIRGFFDL